MVEAPFLQLAQVSISARYRISEMISVKMGLRLLGSPEQQLRQIVIQLLGWH